VFIPTAQELWRLDSPDRFTALAEDAGGISVLYDGPSWADAQDVAEFWKRYRSGRVSILGGAWTA
jgi:hypothetical protein